MRNLGKQLKVNRAALSLIGGLMLAGLLGACSSVDVSVNTSCPPSNMRSTISNPPDEPGAGACTPTPALQSPTDANLYNNAKNTATNQPITDHIHMCNVGTFMCQSSPGTKLCGGTYKPCKTRYTPDVPPNGLTGNCQCGCP